MRLTAPGRVDIGTLRVMNLTRLALRQPAGLAAALAIVAAAGLWAVSTLPIQLFPSIERPAAWVGANWRAASPQEMEAEILEPMEEALQGIPGLSVMESNAQQGFANVGMTFALDTDMDRTLIEIISRLNQLPPMPRDADGPWVNLAGGDANETLIYYFIQRLPGNETSLEESVTFIEDQLIPDIEAVSGVAEVELQAGSGAARQLQIDMDLNALAAYGVSVPQVAEAAGRADDVSAGFADVGRRRYQVRFEGRFDPGDLEELVLVWRDGAPVRLGDVADVTVARDDPFNFAYQNGNPAMSMRIRKEAGANVLATIDEVKAIMDAAIVEKLEPNGLSAAQSFDPSVFILRAIDLLRTNLALGVILAVGVLWLFVRRTRMTLLIAAMIPISILATLTILKLADRTLNVISLAGLAFAVGMTLDAAIVVLENIVRLRDGGMEKTKAARLGAKQVTGALIASTATTVAIFMPVLYMREIEGQLFADLALTIAVAVAMSFIAAITVLPAASDRFLKERAAAPDSGRRLSKLADGLVAVTNTPWRRRGLIMTLFAAPILLAWALTPQLSYLPPVKRDAVDVFFDIPQGAALETVRRYVAEPVIERLQPFMDGSREPSLKNYYFISWGQGATVGARVNDMGQIQEFERIMREEILIDLPDVQAFASQGNLFGGFGGGGENIAVYVQSRDRDAIASASLRATDLLRERFPGANVWPQPSPNVAQPELRVLPNDRRLQEVGWTRTDLGRVVRALGDGLWLGEHFDGEDRLDIILKGDGWGTPEELESAPLVTPTGETVSLGDLAQVERGVGPSQIRRVNQRRTITVQFSPPQGVALKEALDIIKAEVEPEIRSLLPADGSIAYGGSADDLERAIRAMASNFLVALGVLFLLTATLFKSVRDAAYVVVTIPLAAAGGVAALRVLNLVAFQPMDLLTMIGFLILLGLVVNNAILLVARTRQAEAEGLARREAVREALRTRLRPIFMSTLTSLLGMAPLVLMPGVGSAIYRGMAAVIVGGMAINAAFTLLLIPSLLRLGEGAAERRRTETLALHPQPAE